MAQLIKREVTELQFEGGRAKWCLKRGSSLRDDVVNVDGVDFIKLRSCGLTNGFARLVCERVGDGGPKGDTFTLAASAGLKKLIDDRNDCQATLLLEEQINTLPTWARQSVKASLDSKVKIAKRPSAKRSSGVIQITIPGYDDVDPIMIDALRATKNIREDLAVRFDVGALSHIVGFIIDQGFDAAHKVEPRDPSWPQGVYKRGAKWQYTQTVMAGGKQKKIRKTACSFDDAVLKAEQAADGSHAPLEDEAQSAGSDNEEEPDAIGDSDGEDSHESVCAGDVPASAGVCSPLGS
jgi:hypothetical protein